MVSQAAGIDAALNCPRRVEKGAKISEVVARPRVAAVPRRYDQQSGLWSWSRRVLDEAVGPGDARLQQLQLLVDALHELLLVGREAVARSQRVRAFAQWLRERAQAEANHHAVNPPLRGLCHCC